MPDQSVWRMPLPDERATGHLAAFVAELARPGALITLSGDLGAGKTTLARALIRLLTGDPGLEVPSPTFTLMQIYAGKHFPIVHADLYRIADPGELAELGWDEAGDSALLLVEWADRAGVLPPDRLDIALCLDPARGETARIAKLTGYGAYAQTIERARATDALLARTGWDGAQRQFMLGDASTRAYERLRKGDGSTAILMISPARADGPPVRYGKPYSAIARLAENISPFLAMARALQGLGYSAPKILGADAEAGLALLEDLGSEPAATDGRPIPERYAEAAALLADLHARDLPDTVPAGEESTYRIPPYDFDALLIEVELLLDWYVPHVARAQLSSGARAVFVNLWRQALDEAVKAKPTWVLRDYHSPNLIWLPRRSGLQRVGLLDFQDCVIGPAAYDVASLLQDARVTVPGDLEIKLLSHYARERAARDPAFDMGAFVASYAVMGAQRATKILGIFARLDKRDGKPAYLAHLPRIETYLARGLRHPALEDVRAWVMQHLPTLAARIDESA